MKIKENLTEQKINQTPKTTAEKQMDKLILFLKIAAAVMVFIAIMTKFGPYGLYCVSGESMVPTFNNGDILVVDKRKATLNNLQENDIVIAKTNTDAVIDYDIVKRVIGTPGDTVTFCLDEKGELKTWRERNGQKTELNEPYINEPMNTKDYLYDDAGNALTEKGQIYGWVCQEDEYIILGDNRNNSRDSRSYGKFTTKQIKGKVVFRLFPFTKY